MRERRSVATHKALASARGHTLSSSVSRLVDHMMTTAQAKVLESTASWERRTARSTR